MLVARAHPPLIEAQKPIGTGKTVIISIILTAHGQQQVVVAGEGQLGLQLGPQLQAGNRTAGLGGGGQAQAKQQGKGQEVLHGAK